NHAGDRLLSNDWSHFLRVWDWRTGRQLLSMPAGWSLTSRWLHADDQHLFSHSTVSTDGKLWLLRFAAGRERRTVVQSPPGGYFTVADRGGSFLMVHTPDRGHWLRAVGRGTGEELGRLHTPGHSLFFHLETSGALVTCTTGGILRWPRSEESAAGVIRFGAPERLSSLTSSHWAEASPDGRVIALANSGGGAIILHRDHPGLPVVTGPQDDVRHCAVSPDGRLVATGSHGCPSGIGAKVWDARTGALVKDLPVGGLCGVSFSPDGRWLAPTRRGRPPRAAR